MGMEKLKNVWWNSSHTHNLWLCHMHIVNKLTFLNETLICVITAGRKIHTQTRARLASYISHNSHPQQLYKRKSAHLMRHKCDLWSVRDRGIWKMPRPVAFNNYYDDGVCFVSLLHAHQCRRQLNDLLYTFVLWLGMFANSRDPKEWANEMHSSRIVRMYKFSIIIVPAAIKRLSVSISSFVWWTLCIVSSRSMYGIPFWFFSLSFTFIFI